MWYANANLQPCIIVTGIRNLQNTSLDQLGEDSDKITYTILVLCFFSLQRRKETNFFQDRLFSKVGPSGDQLRWNLLDHLIRTANMKKKTTSNFLTDRTRTRRLLVGYAYFSRIKVWAFFNKMSNVLPLFGFSYVYKAQTSFRSMICDYLLKCHVPSRLYITFSSLSHWVWSWHGSGFPSTIAFSESE